MIIASAAEREVTVVRFLDMVLVACPRVRNGTRTGGREMHAHAAGRMPPRQRSFVPLPRRKAPLDEIERAPLNFDERSCEVFPDQAERH